MEDSSPNNRIPSLNNHKKFRDVESRGFYLLLAGGKEVEKEAHFFGGTCPEAS